MDETSGFCRGAVETFAPLGHYAAQHARRAKASTLQEPTYCDGMLKVSCTQLDLFCFRYVQNVTTSMSVLFVRTIL